MSGLIIFNYIKQGEHGATFGGNPLATVMAMEGIKIALHYLK